jgi:hypothetical protein
MSAVQNCKREGSAMNSTSIPRGEAARDLAEPSIYKTTIVQTTIARVPALLAATVIFFVFYFYGLVCGLPNSFETFP